MLNSLRILQVEVSSTPHWLASALINDYGNHRMLFKNIKTLVPLGPGYHDQATIVFEIIIALYPS